MADGTQAVVEQVIKLMGAATLPALAVIGRVLYQRLGAIPVIGREMIQIRHRLADLETKFKPNGGSSLDDLIRGIKGETESIKTELAEFRHKLSGVLSTLEIHNQKHYVTWATYTDGIYESEADSGECTWVNPAMSELFGIDASNMLGRGWLRAVVPEERENVWLRWMECLRNGIPFESEYTIQNHRTREKFRVSTYVIKTIVRDDKPVTYVGIIKRLRDG